MPTSDPVHPVLDQREGRLHRPDGPPVSPAVVTVLNSGRAIAAAASESLRRQLVAAALTKHARLVRPAFRPAPAAPAFVCSCGAIVETALADHQAAEVMSVLASITVAEDAARTFLDSAPAATQEIYEPGQVVVLTRSDRYLDDYHGAVVGSRGVVAYVRPSSSGLGVFVDWGRGGVVRCRPEEIAPAEQQSAAAATSERNRQP